MIRALVSSPMAEWMHRLPPLRLQYELCSDANPAMASVAAALAGQVRKGRRPVDAGNPLVALQENVSRQIVMALDAWRDASEAWAERTFLAVYGMPALQAAFGIDPAGRHSLRSAPGSPLHRELLEARIAELKSRIPAGTAGSRVPRAPLCRHGADLRRRTRLLRRCVGFAGRTATCRCRCSSRWCARNSTCCWSTRMRRLPPFRRCCRPTDKPGSLRSSWLGRRLERAGNSPPEDRKRMNEVARLFGVDADLPASPNLALSSAGAHGQAKKSHGKPRS